MLLGSHHSGFSEQSQSAVFIDFEEAQNDEISHLIEFADSRLEVKSRKRKTTNRKRKTANQIQQKDSVPLITKQHTL
ncbi:MAG: hypothetical protein COA80_19985 [Leeuwenhoekiella sp.]|nr:MAG: hypothetical protein COA80_19985 [Leeuwenhoekiella sp.]